MSGRQERLVQTYSRILPAFADELKRVAGGRRLSYPFLIDIDAHRYREAQTRIVVVSKETNGWGDGGEPEKSEWGFESDKDFVERSCIHYGKFNHGKGSRYARTPLLATFHGLHARLNPKGPENAFVWTNLLKVCQYTYTKKGDKGVRPNWDIVELLLAGFNVVPVEIKLAEPDIVVFFTGPYYDKVLKRTFPNARLSRVSNDFTARQLARVEHDDLPGSSFRTYHPGYLYHMGRVKKERILDVICGAVPSDN